ncbi:Hint domain-containing protein [Stieleria sp. JC731]|uniref:polymorphic toxin-type HINT domain-containing protein n=1 Tax=Pirellulaceae TaxID=2691357 RepID=UPI001E319307|nr:polymorphic toxin-type HINT domain-containing protein [Stieleria sp. JC731]MCC9600701.1 Hint domain-containing protein [Stieleria sp. JC731]
MLLSAIRSASGLSQVLIAILAIAVLVPSATSAEEASDVLVRSKALVQQALQAELQGESQQRQQLLNQAMEFDPENQTANWLSGNLKAGKEWVPVSLAALKNSSDERLLAYHDLRNRLQGNLAGEIELARWCRSNKLSDRERMHWENVLQFDRSNSEARSRLQMRVYKGNWVSLDDITAQRRTDNQREQALKQWMPVISKLAKDTKNPSPTRRAEAWRAIGAIDDANAIPALEQHTHKCDVSLQKHLLETIGRIKDQSSSNALVRLSLELNDSQSRMNAAMQLQQHPVHSYAPQYLDQLNTPIEYRSTLNRMGDALVSQMVIRQERADDVVTLAKTSNAGITTNTPLARQTLAYQRMMLTEYNFQRQRIAQTKRLIDTRNDGFQLSNGRIYEALRVATGEAVDDSPKAWWDWWKGYNEYYIPDNKQQVFLAQTESRQGSIIIPTPPRSECFPAGTLVHTETGKRPIESIRSGDKVLSRDTDTGELMYKLVVRTTVRPPSDTMRMIVSGEVITATVGHPFWVVGQGWTMAKDLNPGDQLHGIEDAGTLEVIEGGLPTEAFNLVVDGTNNYFVGDVGYLVHDNVVRSSNRNPIPGWNGDLVAKSE